MAVNIYESPIKSAVDLEDQITVYVPGYAYFGPEEPTLCTSTSEFEGIYGSSPYTFEADQTVSKISRGSPEKGYLYAKSLLESGIQVLFHRFKTPGIPTALATIPITSLNAPNDDGVYNLVARAISFGPGYKGVKVKLTLNQGDLYDLSIEDSSGSSVYSGTVSMDPTSSLYIKLQSLSLVEFKAMDSSGNIVDIEDAAMLAIVSDEYSVSSDQVTLDYPSGTEDIPECEFYLDDDSANGITGMLTSLNDSGSTGMMYPITDFEKYPSVTYITTGGYYTNVGVAGAQLAIAYKIKAIALIDLDLSINDVNSWNAAKTTLANISGDSVSKGKGAFFVGCNSFDLSPYRIVLGDSFNYLKCLGVNVSNGTAAWIPVANDPNGVSPLGYDTTQKIDTELSETIAEGKIGVSANPLIYSSSAGGYKIMGNRTLLSNDGTLAPNSFLNVSVVVNRVERACRQTANKLKIVSTNANDTFNKFKISVAKTIDPMVVSGDGVQSYTIKKLAKTAAATIDIEINMVVVEGIETFNIYIPYSISLD